MKKNAFTLIELIATIALLGMLATLVITVAVRKINESKEHARDTLFESIELAAVTYVTENGEDLPDFQKNDYIYVTLQTLVEKEYFTNSLKDPTTDKALPLTDTVYVTRNQNGNITATYDANQRKNAHIVLNGAYNEYLKIGTEYTEKGVLATSSNGSDISSSITTTGTVDTTKAGTYTITYTYNNKTITRNVIVYQGNSPSETVKRPIKLTIKINDGAINQIFEENYFAGTNSQVVYEIKDIDMSNMTNVSCNNGAIPSLENNKLKLNNMVDNTTCLINKSLVETINNLDNTETNIVMLSNEEINSTITIGQNNNVVLDLNGKTITRTAEFYNNGTLKLISSNTHGTMTTSLAVIRNNENAKLETKNVKLISTNEDNTSAICTKGYLEVNENSYIEGVYGIGCHDNENAKTVINGGTIKGTIKNGINLNENYKSNLIINSGYVYGYEYSVVNSNLGIVTINGGTFISENNSSITNRLTGTGIININQTTIPIYISTLAQKWAPAINNESTGTINITANVANQCTNNSTDTTSGLCVYAEGDKNYSSNTANGAVRNGVGGTININGGTYYGGHQAINNGAGIISIKSGSILSSYYGVLNNSTGTINICNASISAPKELHISSTATGIINYSSNVIFTDGANSPIVSGITTNIIPNYTGTCSS